MTVEEPALEITGEERDIPDQELIVRELKRCADEITSTDLSLQTIRELIGRPTEEE